MVVKASDLNSQIIPQPFLNRFEKYCLSHEIVLQATLSSLPPAMAQLLRAVLNKVSEHFVFLVSFLDEISILLNT